MKTETKKEVKTIDASGRTLGRVASEVAKILLGKTRADFQRHLEAGVELKVVNAGKLKISPAKSVITKPVAEGPGFPLLPPSV